MSIVDKIISKFKKPTQASNTAPTVEASTVFQATAMRSAFCAHCSEPIDRGVVAYGIDHSGRGFCSIPCAEERQKLDKEI